ncbi:translation initiation factor IF-2-like [Rousettus aegyptiacus]|uniref:translation initiation factor IF-2-like n=1 Tax=Rousettus aegyptiacus TaxID=9407 RepID=UPI00168D0BA5|nr:translation initiation factor IF-2-like [Rousettus aegyptiacus]XP_036081104.1 translation initiation factor IF-2-like [Rousettus aegyptiacus]
MRGCGLRDVLDSRPGSFGGGRGRRPHIPQTAISSLESQFSNTHARGTTRRLLATGKAAKRAQRGPGARPGSTGTNFRNREKLSREDARRPRGACGSLGCSRRGPSTPRAPEGSCPARPARAQAPGPAGKADGPSRPPATGFPTGSRSRRSSARRRSPSARLGSPRPHEESYLRRAGRAQEDSRGLKPTAAALSPSRPTPRRKRAALRPRPRPAPARGPRPPPRRPGAVRSSQHLPPAALPGASRHCPAFPGFGASPQSKELGDAEPRPQRGPLVPHTSPRSYLIPCP